MPCTRVALLVLFSSLAFGQDAALSLRVDTTLVQIPVAVTDSMNRFVLGLQKEEFRLTEDGVETDRGSLLGRGCTPVDRPGL